MTLIWEGEQCWLGGLPNVLLVLANTEPSESVWGAGVHCGAIVRQWCAIWLWEIRLWALRQKPDSQYLCAWGNLCGSVGVVSWNILLLLSKRHKAYCVSCSYLGLGLGVSFCAEDVPLFTMKDSAAKSVSYLSRVGWFRVGWWQLGGTLCGCADLQTTPNINSKEPNSRWKPATASGGAEEETGGSTTKASCWHW